MVRIDCAGGVLRGGSGVERVEDPALIVPEPLGGVAADVGVEDVHDGLGKARDVFVLGEGRVWFEGAMEFHDVACPTDAFHDGKKNGDGSLAGELGHARVKVGVSAEEADGDAWLSGAQVGHDGEELAGAQVGENLAEEVGGAALEKFDAGGVAKLLEIGVDEGVFLVAGDGEHVDMAGGSDEAGEFPVAHVGAGEDAAAAGVGGDVGAELGEGGIHIDGAGKGAGLDAAHVDDFGEIESHVAKGNPCDGACGRVGAEDGADAADGFVAAGSGAEEQDAGDGGGEEERQAIGQARGDAANGAEEGVFGDVLRAVFHDGETLGAGERDGTRLASRRSSRAAGRKRTANSTA